MKIKNKIEFKNKKKTKKNHANGCLKKINKESTLYWFFLIKVFILVITLINFILKFTYRKKLNINVFM
jgi:hypothetical protein